MRPIFRTFYVSRASAPFDAAAAQSILQTSRRNNARIDVTGCLLYSGRCFAQVLEGGESVVRALTARIAEDARHGSIRVLNEASAGEREYGDWSMGFLHDLNLEDDLEMLLMIPGRSPAVVAEVMERMRPDPVMGALR
jgi:hypothetical protein